MWRPADTSGDAHRLQIEAYRSMTSAERLRLADEMSTEVRRLAEAGRARREQRPAAAAREDPAAPEGPTATPRSR